MNVALTRPAVSSSGNLDSYDGLVTCTLLQRQAAALGAGVPLAAEVASLAALVEARWRAYASDDPLDLGEALWLAHFGLQPSGGAPWARHVAAASLAGLDGLWAAGYFDQPLRRRLAFREMGAALGVQALLAVRPATAGAELWRRRVAQLHAAWAADVCGRDRDISPVMLAASLLPGLWLAPQQPPPLA